LLTNIPQFFLRNPGMSPTTPIWSRRKRLGTNSTTWRRPRRRWSPASTSPSPTPVMSRRPRSTPPDEPVPGL